MENYKTMAYVQSLNIGKMQPEVMAEVTILRKVGDNDYIADYNGVKCHAIFNWFVCEYFADDVYGRIEE